MQVRVKGQLPCESVCGSPCGKCDQVQLVCLTAWAREEEDDGFGQQD